MRCVGSANGISKRRSPMSRLSGGTTKAAWRAREPRLMPEPKSPLKVETAGGCSSLFVHASVHSRVPKNRDALALPKLRRVAMRPRHALSPPELNIQAEARGIQ
jgi:hypothetical protein